ncbi:hypothetical protein RHOSPDRAFT_14383, partial [Rhodotorula sp. JG-1b]
MATRAGGESVIPLQNFVKEVLRRSRTSCSTLQLALYYLHKSRRGIRDARFTALVTAQNSPVLCGRRMFLAALISASKYLQDRNYSNRAWAKISGLPVGEINGNERAFLKVVDFKLHLPAEEFQRWTERL